MIRARLYRSNDPAPGCPDYTPPTGPSFSTLAVFVGSAEMVFRFGSVANQQSATLSRPGRSLSHRDGLERLAAKLDSTFLAVVGQIPAGVRRPKAW